MKFTCDECKNEFPHGNLSESSLLISGKDTKAEAVQVLTDYDLVCTRCQSLIEGSLEDHEPDGRGGLSNLQEWYYSGLTLDAVQKDWLNLNF
jgi:hypothetical protein